MTRFRFAPVHGLTVAVVLALAMTAFVVLLAQSPAWMGLRLAFDPATGAAVVRSAAGPAAAVPIGTRLTSIADAKNRMGFVADDFVYEPDGSLGTFAAYEVFLARQDRLSRIQNAPSVVLRDDQGRSWTIRPEPRRPLSSLPPDFWVQVVVGVVAWLIAASIWAFRSGETSARYLLLSGWATLMFSPLAASYSTRELALPATIFRWVNDLNFLGGSLFAAALASLLLYYPRPLAPRWVGLSIVGVFLAWFVAQQAGLFESMTLARRLLVLIAVLATFVLAAVQWRFTRTDPVARAALQWFLLSWLAGVGVFALAVLLPQVFGVDTSALQGYGFLLFLLVYVGLAFGVLRFRLFELGEWWFRALLWTGGVLLLVAFDLAFALGLRLSSGLSLSLALLLCGLAWLPLRGWLWSRVFQRAEPSERAVFETVVEVALSRDEDQSARWQATLEDLFDPLHVRPVPAIETAALDRDGLALLIPGAGGLPSLRLEYAQGGRRLFNRRDLARAGEIVGMLRHVLASRRAYEQGVAGERQRIARDMHDNIGAQLLHALHSSGDARKDRLIRETLSDLGAIINDAAAPENGLHEALSDIRFETAERLSAAGLTLDWPIEQGDAIRADPALLHALRSLIRECVSNIVKHADARHVTVRAAMDRGSLALSVEDDGSGFDLSCVDDSGAGLGNLRGRVAARGGAIAWSRGADGAGTRVDVLLPISLDDPARAF